MGESLYDSTLKQHGKQIKEILNHLDELPIDRIERIEDDVEALGKGRVIIQQDYDQMRVEFQRAALKMPPKRSSTSEASTMSQATIRKLVADSIGAALETQTATMAEADNSIREIPVAKRRNYKEFISCQPFYFNENKVAFATGTLTNDALSWWNAYAQPIGIGKANRITWTELKSILTNKYTPRTEIKKMEDEFYNLSVKGNDLKAYVRRFQELAILCPNMVLNNEKLMEVFISRLPTSIKGNVTALKPQTLEEAINIAQREKGHYRSQCSKTNFNANGRTNMLRDKNVHQDPNVVMAHVARAPYRLAPSEMQELSNQLQESADRGFIHQNYDCEIRYHPGKANVVADALSQKRIIKSRRVKPLHVRSLIMTIHLNLPSQILEAQTKALKKENVQAENLQGMKNLLKSLLMELIVLRIEVGYHSLERITLDFVTKLPRTTNEHDSIWVIVDRLTKFTHFIPTRETESMDTLTWLYIKEIISRHGVPISIILDRDSHFTSRFWQSLQNALGAQLDMSTTYHPETDGQSERTIQTLEDMLRACAIDFGKGWEKHYHW
nr:reverse transcriptase domain-containing protein [Tanacetum cinerariifolium]